MKRELKLAICRGRDSSSVDCRAYPDEKGIETIEDKEETKKRLGQLQSLSR